MKDVSFNCSDDLVRSKRKRRRKSGPKPKLKQGKCIVCDSEINEDNYNPSFGTKFCSWRCYEKNKSISTSPNAKCRICKKEFYLKPSRIVKAKNGVCCSNECKYKLKAFYMSGEGNHQYGLKGEKNASFVGKNKINQYGYNMIYLPNHPKADINGRYREHRYVIEQDASREDFYFDIINNIKVLKDKYHVHHVDGNKLNNNPSNLNIVTMSEHTSLHNKENTIVRNIKGRIIGVFKKGELLENPEEDNQQPS